MLLTHSDLLASACPFNYNFAHDGQIDLGSPAQQHNVTGILSQILIGLSVLAGDEDEVLARSCGECSWPQGNRVDLVLI